MAATQPARKQEASRSLVAAPIKDQAVRHSEQVALPALAMKLVDLAEPAVMIPPAASKPLFYMDRSRGSPDLAVRPLPMPVLRRLTLTVAAERAPAQSVDSVEVATMVSRAASKPLSYMDQIRCRTTAAVREK